ncbi:MAG: malectin domain-containing carbohydrate-binding protein [Aggregatilineales bacterium]
MRKFNMLAYFVLIFVFANYAFAQDNLSSVLDIAWGPDGTLVATAERNGTIEIWDTTTSQVIRILEGHADEVIALDWHDQSNRLASVSPDGNLIIWDADTWQPITIFSLGNNPATPFLDVTWSPDGTKIALGSLRTIFIYDTQINMITDRLTDHLTTFETFVHPLIWNPTGDTIFSIGDTGQLLLWSISDDIVVSEIRFENLRRPNAMSWHPTGSLVAILEVFGGVKVIDPFSGVIVSDFQASDTGVIGFDIEWSLDGSHLITSGQDQMIKVWDAQSLQLVDSITTSEIPFAIDINPVNGDVAYFDDIVAVFDPLINVPPLANAGTDQTVVDADGNSSESVVLNGSGSSDADGSIVSYSWQENGAEIATGVMPSVDLTVGTYTFTLTVTDNDGLTATDEVVITVNANQPPGQLITSLTLINADTNSDIRTLSTTSTETIDIASNDISIRVDTDPATVGSVVFTVDGNVVATDNSAPYTIAGENGSDILPWNIALGQHTVVATPYSGADGTGDAGTPLTVQVNIVDSSQSGLAVTSMTLINADTDTDIRSLLTSGTDTIDISANGISIRANTSPATVGSVRFALNGNANYRTENGVPYAIYNNEPGAYQPWVVAPGNYTLTATPYSGSNGSGTAGTPLTVNFDIVNTPPSGSCTATGGLVQEGEAGVRAGNFVVANDTIASGGQYVHVPEGTGSNYSPGSSSNVRFCFPVTEAGTYRLKAWVHSADGGADSFYVGYNGATIQWNTEINTIYSIGYVRGSGTPINSAQEYTLSSGNQEFTFFLREDGARLDKVELVNTVSNETVVYRVDAGASSAYTDTLGNVWSADSNFSGGSANSFSASILSTIDDPLYTTERSQSNNVGFSYSFPVSNGNYTVRLHFAEIWFTGGSGRGAIDSPSARRRVFDVQIEGTTVLDEFHIVSETLQPRVAHVETFVVNVTDGTLNINFPPATTDNPTIEAIEIVQGG